MTSQNDKLGLVFTNCEMDLILNDRMCLSRVNTDHQDAVGLSNLLNRVCGGGNSEGLLQPLRQPPVRPRVVDLVRSDSVSKKLPEEMVFLIGQAARCNAGDGFRAILILDRFETVGNKSEGLLPGSLFKSAVHS